MLIINNETYSPEQFIEEFGNSEKEYLKNICSVLTDWKAHKKHMELTTSGSTSTAKTVTLSKSSMRTSALRTQEFFGYKKDDNAILCLPVKFIGGMMMLIRSIVSDINLYILEPSLNPLTKLQSNVQFVPMTPAQLSKTIEVNSSKIEYIDKILLGGGPVNSALMRKISKLRADVYHSFGMTETISHIAIKQLNPLVKDNYYNALKGVKFSVDEDSCLIIKADYLSETIMTNDVVELINEEQFIWKGRKDNVVISGGLKLYPEIIEQKLSQVINDEYFITGIEDELLGKKLCLVIENDSVIDSDYTLDKIKKYLDKYEIPKLVYGITQFERTETGKVKRAETLEQVLENNKQSVI
jgi:O-succinylbenzoic acid--CoA ligase